jgi:hypothetical protein
MVLFLRRAFQRTSYTHAMSLCYVAIAVLSVWGVGAAIAVSVNCGSEHLCRRSENATCKENVSTSPTRRRVALTITARPDGLPSPYSTV